MWERFVGRVYTVATVLIIAGLVWGCYETADDRGWIPHERSVSVWMPDGWLAGEQKPCLMSGYSGSLVMSCGIEEMSTSHQMDVVFNGPIKQIDAKTDYKWTCQRKAESIACKTR